MTVRYALRDPEQRKDELKKEQDQHPDGTSIPERKVKMLRRRKHMYQKPVTTGTPRITSVALPSTGLLQIGEIILRPQAPVALLATAFSAQVAEMGVTLDVIVEPVNVDPKHPSLKVYVDTKNSDPAGIAHAQHVTAKLSGVVR